jgi:hypothetical protein
MREIIKHRRIRAQSKHCARLNPCTLAANDQGARLTRADAAHARRALCRVPDPRSPMRLAVTAKGGGASKVRMHAGRHKCNRCERPGRPHASRAAEHAAFGAACVGGAPRRSSRSGGRAWRVCFPRAPARPGGIRPGAWQAQHKRGAGEVRGRGRRRLGRAMKAYVIRGWGGGRGARGTAWRGMRPRHPLAGHAAQRPHPTGIKGSAVPRAPKECTVMEERATFFGLCMRRAGGTRRPAGARPAFVPRPALAAELRARGRAAARRGGARGAAAAAPCPAAAAASGGESVAPAKRPRRDKAGAGGAGGNPRG